MAARAVGLPVVPCRVRESPAQGDELYLTAFWDNIESRAIDRACVAHMTARLLELVPRARAAGELLPLLGVPPRGPVLERVRRIGLLELPVLHLLSHGRIKEKTAALLTDLDPQERGALVKLMEELHLNANKAAEITERLFDLATFHDTGIRDILARTETREVLEDRETGIAERAERLRGLLRSWKFPELIGLEHEFERRLGSRTRGSSITVRPAPGFETSACTVQIVTANWADAEVVVARLRELS